MIVAISDDKFKVCSKSVGSRHSHQNPMMRKESDLKPRAMRQYIFGKYLVSVPRFKEYRYRDVPLATSAAVPHVKEEQINIVKHKRGQRIVGDMVPAW